MLVIFYDYKLICGPMLTHIYIILLVLFCGDPFGEDSVSKFA